MPGRLKSAARASADESLLPTDRPIATPREASRYRLHVSLLIIIILVLGIFAWSADIISAPQPSTRDTADAAKAKNERLPSKSATYIQLKPYKDTNIHLPVIPSYGTPYNSQLGYDHIYIIHRVGHPANLLRMTRLLQLLRISAEFVPIVYPAHAEDASAATALSPQDIVEWRTRYRIYRDMAECGYKSALILDDSVDMELNIKTIMREIHRHIPSEWDMFFPGHCGAFEGIQPKPDRSFPSLRHANMPICLHAHAISRKGLLLLLRHLQPTPSSDIISMAIMRLKERGILHMYSLDKPIFTPVPGIGEETSNRLADNKKLHISATSYLSLWQRSTTRAPAVTSDSQ